MNDRNAASLAQVLAQASPDGQLGLPNKNMDAGHVWKYAKIKLGLDDQDLVGLVAKASGLPVAEDLGEPNPEALILLTRHAASVLNVLPLAVEGNACVVAIADPFDSELQQLVRFGLNRNFRMVIASPSAIEEAILKAYVREEDTESKIGRANLDEKDVPDAEVPRLLRLLFSKALNQKASDMHIQGLGAGTVVRIRIDGVLERLVMLPNKVAKALIRHVKIQSGMDPTNVMTPQDGRMTLRSKGMEYDLRLSTLPQSANEEKLVIRFLSRRTIHKLHQLGLSLDEIHSMRRMVASPSGIILVCGPTGSGKTTTLYSLLSEVDSSSLSIATVENPVEYSIPGFAQTEINEKKGMTFAKALRSVLRQDPDVILVGEIRDGETAQIAAQAALTGHLVFSTLHTRDIFSTVSRLQDLGITPKVLAEALVGVISQRLLRRVCENCREQVEQVETDDEKAFARITRVLPPHRATGCEQCRYTGYAGRLVVTELFEVTEAMADKIASGTSSPAELQALVGDRFRTLGASAARHIISGDTTAVEASRVLGQKFWEELCAEYGVEANPALFEQALENVSGKPVGILFLGEKDSYADDLVEHMRKNWPNLHWSSSPDDAKRQLESNDNIGFAVLRIDGELNDAAVLQLVRDYRAKVAWSRLPALLLLPADRMDLEDKLVADGATSKFISADTPPEEVVQIISSALSRHLDFKWKG